MLIYNGCDEKKSEDPEEYSSPSLPPTLLPPHYPRLLAFTALLQAGTSCTHLTVGSLKPRVWVVPGHMTMELDNDLSLSSPLWLCPKPPHPLAGEGQRVGDWQAGEAAGFPVTSIFPVWA